MDEKFEGRSKTYIYFYKKAMSDFDSMYQPHKKLMSVTMYCEGYFSGGVRLLNKDVVEARKDAFFDMVADEFFGGCEPTFNIEEGYNWWNNLSVDSFEQVYDAKHKEGSRNTDRINSSRKLVEGEEEKYGWGSDMIVADLTKPAGFRFKKDYGKMPELMFEI